MPFIVETEHEILKNMLSIHKVETHTVSNGLNTVLCEYYGDFVANQRWNKRENLMSYTGWKKTAAEKKKRGMCEMKRETVEITKLYINRPATRELAMLNSLVQISSIYYFIIRGL